MRNLIMALPRTGSAWLASYFGYLHDPMASAGVVPVGYSVVDTGAAINPSLLYEKFEPDRCIIMLRDSGEVVQSLTRLGFVIKLETVQRWCSTLLAFSLARNIRFFDYEQIFRNDTDRLELCRELGEEYDTFRFKNQMLCNVQQDITTYTTEGYDEYKRWLHAP